MRKLTPFILGIAAIAWLIGGTVWYKNRYCDAVQTSAYPAVNVSQAANETTIQTTPFYFAFGETRALFLQESIQSFKQATAYLNQNTDKSLIIKGLYSSTEMKLKPNNDLGLQRAEAIKNVLMDFGVHNSAVETVSERSDNVHFINNQLVDGIEFTISDAPQTSFQALNLYFPIKSYQFKITDELESYFTNLKKFLSKNATAKLNVYAYADDEFKQDENSKIRAKRLTYLKNVLKNRDFKLTQFQFQMGSQKPMIEQNSNILKTQRIEIRLATP